MKPLFATLLWAGVAAQAACLDIDLSDEVRRSSTEPSGTADPGTDAGTDSGDESLPSAPESDPNDTSPPSVSPAACGFGETRLDAVCAAAGPASLSLRFTTTEPATVVLDDSDAPWELRMLTPDWATEHHALAVVASAPPGPVVVLLVSDATRNATRLEVPVSLPGTALVALTEILADPSGAEPDQEFVEVANLGAEPIDLRDWMIDDNGDRNGDLLPAGSVLPPSGVGLIVGPGFDLSAVRSGAAVFVLDGSIGSSGLRNDPLESLELYDAAGVLVSAYPGLAAAPQEGCSAARRHLFLPDGAPGAFAADESGGASPGAL